MLNIKNWWQKRTIKSCAGIYAYYRLDALNVLNYFSRYFLHGIYSGRPYVVTIYVQPRDDINAFPNMLSIHYDTEDFWDKDIPYILVFHDSDKIHFSSIDFSQVNDLAIKVPFKYVEKIERSKFSLWMELLSQLYLPSRTY
jgi:hypothetical protein